MTGGSVPGFLSGYRRDYYGGALMVLIGVYAAAQGATYGIGTLTAMGAGFFPMALGVILALLGIAIAGTAKRPRARLALNEDSAPTESTDPEWRGWFCILAAVASFPIVGRWGGLLPATFVITFLSALGDRDNTLVSAATLACVMAAIATGVFWWALQLQLPLFTWG